MGIQISKTQQFFSIKAEPFDHRTQKKNQIKQNIHFNIIHNNKNK